jgi:hypothetical protein
MTIPKRTVSFSNDETGTDWRLVTAEELAALEARKQVPAEVIARTQGALIGWQNADEFDADELQEHGDVLRDATRALLAAVEAGDAPEGERLTEARKQVPAEVIAEARASLSERLDAWGAAHRLWAALRNLLAAVEAAPDE